MSKDVELVIRAKDAATSAIDSIKDALKDLTGIQDKVGKSAAKTDTLLGDLGRQLRSLTKEAQGLSAFGKIAGEMERAGNAVERLESTVKGSAAEFAKLARESKQAEASANSLRQQLENEQNAIKQSTQARKAANAELRDVNKLVKEAEANQRRYNKAVGDTAVVKQSSAQRSAGVFVGADLDAARAQQARLKTEVAGFNAEIDRSREATKTLRTQVAAAAQEQGVLARETDKAAGALRGQRADLDRARTEFGQIKSVAGQASTALGGMAVDQDRVAAASQRMAAELARTKARIDALNSSQRSGGTIDTSGLAEQRRALLEARRDWVQAQDEVKRLAQAYRSTVAPTEEMGSALGRAQAQARLAKQAYVEQREALHNLGSSAKSSFAAFSQSVSQMGVANRGFAASASQVSNAIRPMAPAVSGAGSAMQGASGGANTFRGALSNLYGESRKSLSLMQRLRGEVLSLTASFVGFHALFNNIGGVVKAYMAVEAAQSRLGAVFHQDTGRVAQELTFLEREADRLGISFATLSTQYGKFAVAADAANISSKSTRDIFISVAEAGRVNKMSIDQLNGIFLALEQMISKGKVSSEELRRQLGDRLPGAFNIMADALGKSTAELDNLMRKGKVLANEETMTKFANELVKRFGSQLPAALRTTTTELGRFQNNLFQAQLRFAEGGFVEGFTDALRSMNEWFRSREGRDFFLSLGAAAGRFAEGLAKIPRYFSEIKVAVSVLVGLKIASFFTDIVGAIRQTRGSVANMSRDFFTWSGTVKSVQGTLAGLKSTTALVTGGLVGMRTQVLGVSTAWGIAGARFVAAQASLLVLRGALTIVTGAARLMWAAVGGLPGLIATGITFALASWLTGVDDTTKALDEHKRIMDEVLKAYDSVKDKTADWAKEIKNVTADQVNANLRQLLDTYNKIRGGAVFQNAVPTFTAFIEGWSDVAAKINVVRSALLNGKSSIKEYREALDNIYTGTTNEKAQVFIESLLEAARKAESTEKAVGDLAVTAKVMGTGFKDVDDVIARTGASIETLTGKSDDATDQLTRMRQASEKVNSVFEEMRKLIPGIADEFKRLEAIDALDKQYKDAVKLAQTMSQIMGLTDQYNKSLSGLIDGAFGANSSLVDKIVGVESGGNTSAKNPNSTATGLGQFIADTWLRMFKQYFPDRAASMTDIMILELRKNADISKQMVALYVQENAAIMKKAGIAVTDANLYLAHFLGPGGATKVLKAPAGTPVQGLLDQSQINANPSILGGGKTTDQVIAWAQQKIGMSKEEWEIQKKLAELDNKREQKQKDFNTDLENRLSLQEDENSNAGRLTQEAFVQKRLAEEMKRARQDGLTLTDEQIARVKEVAAKEWEVAQAKRDGKATTQEANAALQQAVALNSQRNALQQQFNQAVREGNTDQATVLQDRLTEVNSKLEEAIAKARAMWEAIGGPQADIALTKLDTLKIKADSASNSMSMFGLSTQQVKQLAGSFADGLVGVFDSFAQAIANGENAVKALGKAFLQFAANFLRQIAQMILKQIILNALQRFLPGLGLAGAAHTGGVVGAGLIGSGNMTRRVAPAAFAAALAYHSGGIAGLAPDEVPAVLKQGEEVITRDDPRHRMNGGRQRAAASAPTSQTLRNIIVFDDESAANWLSSPAGEQVFMSYLSKNAAKVRSILGS